MRAAKIFGYVCIGFIRLRRKLHWTQPAWRLLRQRNQSPSWIKESTAAQVHYLEPDWNKQSLSSTQVYLPTPI